MAYTSLRLVMTQLLPLGLAALLGGGCAIATGGQATANNATAQGGTATSNVHVNANLSLGDAVARAAAETVRSIMSPAGALGAITSEKKLEAVKGCVASGIDEAQKGQMGIRGLALAAACVAGAEIPQAGKNTGQFVIECR